jgi:hypothetical protein
VAQPTNETKAGILPETELNPLINPLLAAHMGRWAEVYFTSPPEKRAQAVSDLVRELSSDPPSTPVVSATASREAMWPKHEEANEVSSSDPDATAALGQPTVVCESCGHRNAAPQRFCGMCGVPLTSSSEPAHPLEESEPIAPTDWHEADARQAGVPEREVESAARASPEDYYTPPNPAWPPPENSPAEFSMLSEYQSEPARHPYRIYVGVFVAILLGLLVYVTWRNNSAFWSSGTAPSALPQAVPTAKPDTPAPADAPAATSTQPNAKSSSTPTNAPSRPAAPNPNRAAVSPGNDRGLERRSSPLPAKSRSSPPPAAVSASAAAGLPGQSGAEELSLAEKYLNGGPGAARDSRQAAMLLWKAVAKQNLTATLVLSDLYLRGDGVSKSCDQARLLLDAAARKGAAGAAERLRNLSAFGCR